MVNAYIPYGNGGTYYKSHLVSRLEQGNHELVFENTGDPHEAVDAETAYIMNRMMKNVVSSEGTAGVARLSKKEVVGKTGTTQDWGDLWFIGLTEDFVSGAWIGYVQRDKLDTSTSSAQLWHNIIGEYANSLDTGAKYPVCETVISAPICVKTGKIAGSTCEKGDKGYWKSENAPKCSGCVAESTEDPSATDENGETGGGQSATSATNGGGGNQEGGNHEGGDTPDVPDPPEPPEADPPAPEDPQEPNEE